jgi:N-acetylmuramoyl-L-alanine amidase
LADQQNRAILRGNGIELSFKVQSRTFHMNGVLMPLGFQTKARAGKLYMSHSDYVSHLCPFFSSRLGQRTGKLVIVLDPGHGGHNDGALSVRDGLKEKVANLDICKKLMQLLTKQGHTVYLTRNSDAYVELDDRTKLANQKSANLFVSVHCNAAKSKSANGVETFALTPHGQPSHGKTDLSTSEFKRHNGNKFDGENLLLAYNIQRAILKTTRSLDRGVKHSRFHVLKGLNCPGVLVECGFLSNVSDSRKLASDAYRQALAQAIADGISAFTR